MTEQDTPPAADAPASGTWSRDGFFIRLTAARKAKLLAVAAELGASASPIAAIDRALEFAGVSLRDSADGESQPSHANGSGHKDATLDEALARLETQARREREALGLVAREVSQRFHALSDLISAAMESGDAPETQPLDAWFSEETARRGLNVGKIAIAKARWASLRRVSGGSFEAEFDVELVGADGKRLAQHVAGAARARLQGLGEGGAVVGAPMDEPIYLGGQPRGDGRWDITAFQCRPDGSIGETLSMR